MSRFRLGQIRSRAAGKNLLAFRQSLRSLDLELLEGRQYLSASPAEIATPDYEEVRTSTGATPQDTSGPTGMTPAEIKSAYGFSSVTFTGGVAGTGAGTTIAIVDAYDDPNIASDLHQFDLAFGLPDTTLTKVNETGGSTLPAGNKGWATEIALDVEWAHAIAPGANILLVEASSASMSDLMTAVNTARNAAGVVAVTMSWGGGEYSGETSYDSYFTTPAGHIAESFFVSSGDDGAPVSYPAASPNVVSVGGTSLVLNGTSYGSESAWSGSGGGLSSYESQPAYQQGVVTQSSTARANPDVAYDADPNTGFPVYDSYNNGTKTPWGQWGGTSDAAPQWAALTAIADQGRELAGSGSLNGATQLLPALYSLPSTDFHDITTGASTGSPSYSAGAGYDLATGLGTPVANLLIAGLVSYGGSQTPTAPAAPANFSAQAISSTQVSVSWSLSSGATGYELYSGLGSATPVVVGTYSASTTSATISGLTAGATYSFQIVASNSTGTGASGLITVTLPSSGTLSAPGNFTVTAASSTSATLTWTAPQGATGYKVYSQVPGGPAVLAGTYGASTTSATITGLTAGGTYAFEVVASNSTTTAATSWVSVTLPGSTGGLSAPQNFTVTAVSSTVAQLAWSASTGATGYTVYYWNGSQAVNLGSVSSRTTSVNVTGLKAGSTDKFYITAYNATTSASTGWVTVVMPGGAVAVTAPQNFTATATSSTTGTLSWTASPGATGYIIYYWDGYQAVAIDTVGASTTSVNIGGMSASSTYQFAIVAYNATSSAATAWVSLTTPSAATTAAAQRVAQETAVAMMFSEVTKRWTTT